MARDKVFLRLGILFLALTIIGCLLMSEWAFGAELFTAPDGRTLQCFETDDAAKLAVDLQKGKQAIEVAAAQGVLIEALQKENDALRRQVNLLTDKSAQQDVLIGSLRDGDRRDSWLRPVENAAYTLGGIGLCVGSAWAMGQVAK